MLIICAGPETFLAHQKTRELVEAYRQKHVSQGATIEHLEAQTSILEAMAKLSSQGLFSSKRLLKYENLLSGVTQTQAKQLSKSLVADANQTIVLTYEDKAPAKKILELFPQDLLFVYQYETLKGRELLQWISARCKFYGVETATAEKLIELHENDLWAIDTSLQIIQALGAVDQINKTFEAQNQVFSVIDQFFKQNSVWREQAATLDAQELLPLLTSQLINWHKIQSGQTEGIHPFVQKKLSGIRLSDPDEKALQVIRALYASRHSLAQNQEILQIF